MWQCWASFGAGLWLAAISISLSRFPLFNTIDDFLVGMVVIILALWTALRKILPMWITTGLGIWLVIAAWIPGISGNTTPHLLNGLIVGILIMVFSAWAGSIKVEEEKKEEVKEEEKKEVEEKEEEKEKREEKKETPQTEKKTPPTKGKGKKK
jgi:uncharacterized membrane protein